MKLFKTLVSTLILSSATILAAQAQAATITVAGYTFKPLTAFNYTTQPNTFTQTRTAAGPAGAVGDMLSGSGTINAEGGQKLNFLFSGLTSTGISGSTESFSGGQFDVFTASTGEFLARFAFNQPVTFNYFSTGSATQVFGFNSSMFNLGAAALDKPGNNTDVLINSTASLPGNLFVGISNLADGQSVTYTDGNSGQSLLLNIVGYYGNTTSFIPEPASLALAGLGLLGIAGLRRRKQKA